MNVYWWVSVSSFILNSVGVNLKCIENYVAQERGNNSNLEIAHICDQAQV